MFGMSVVPYSLASGRVCGGIGALVVLFLGTGLPEDHWHSSDESVDLRMLQRGAASIAHLRRELAGVLSARR